VTKQQQLVELLIQKGSVDLLDLQKGTHGIRTSHPASLISELRAKGYDITTYKNNTADGKYISTVYKLNNLPLPEDITAKDLVRIQSWDNQIEILKEKIDNFKNCRKELLKKYD